MVILTEPRRASTLSPDPSANDLALVPPGRLGQLLRAARERRGWSLARLADETGRRFDLEALEALEAGRRGLLEPELVFLASVYGVPTGRLLPGRMRLVIDRSQRRIETADETVQLRWWEPRSTDRVLNLYLDLIYALRGVSHGPMPLRQGDIATLAEALGHTAFVVDRRLSTLMRRRTAGTSGRLESRVVIPAAGVLLAVTAVGSLVFESERDLSGRAHGALADFARPQTTILDVPGSQRGEGTELLPPVALERARPDLVAVVPDDGRDVIALVEPAVGRATESGTIAPGGAATATTAMAATVLGAVQRREAERSVDQPGSVVDPTTTVAESARTSAVGGFSLGDLSTDQGVLEGPLLPALSPALVSPATLAPAPPEPAAAPPPPTPAAPPSSTPLASKPTHLRVGEAALARISYPWQSRLPGWRIEFLPARSGYLGGTMWQSKTIEIYVRDSHSVADVAVTVAHELGHAVDIEYNSDADRARWRSARGIDAAAPWWGRSGESDYATPSGDFAEAFAAWQVGPSDFRSRLAGPPDDTHERLLRELSR